MVSGGERCFDGVRQRRVGSKGGGVTVVSGGTIMRSDGHYRFGDNRISSERTMDMEAGWEVRLRWWECALAD